MSAAKWWLLALGSAAAVGVGIAVARSKKKPEPSKPTPPTPTAKPTLRLPMSTPNVRPYTPPNPAPTSELDEETEQTTPYDNTQLHDLEAPEPLGPRWRPKANQAPLPAPSTPNVQPVPSAPLPSNTAPLVNVRQLTPANAVPPANVPRVNVRVNNRGNTSSPVLQGTYTLLSDRNGWFARRIAREPNGWPAGDYMDFDNRANLGFTSSNFPAKSQAELARMGAADGAKLKEEQSKATQTLGAMPRLDVTVKADQALDATPYVEAFKAAAGFGPNDTLKVESGDYQDLGA